MAKCKLCGTRYWFFSNHICKPQQVTKKNDTYPKTPVQNIYTKQTIRRDSDSSAVNDLQQQQMYAQQLLQQQAFLTSSSDDTCRSEPNEATASHHQHESSVSIPQSSYSPSYDSGSSYSSDSSSSSCDSSSSSSSGWD